MSHAERQLHAYRLGSWGMEVWGGGGGRERGLGAASQRLQNLDGLPFGRGWVLKSD